MTQCVTTGAICQCSFGAAPSSLVATPPAGGIGNAMPVMTVEMTVPMENVMPFGMCSSLANPEVASATSDASGVLTPMPCVPVIAAPWSPPSTSVTLGSAPAVLRSSKCQCTWGGVISITEMAPTAWDAT